MTSEEAAEILCKLADSICLHQKNGSRPPYKLLLSETMAEAIVTIASSMRGDRL